MAVEAIGAIAPPAPAARYPRTLRFHPAQALLAPHAQTLGGLAYLAAAPERHWRHYYDPALDAAATLTQTLVVEGKPLLAEILAALAQSLRRRQGHYLPLGAEPEAIAAQADGWTYAVFTATLLRTLASALGNAPLSVASTPGARDFLTAAFADPPPARFHQHAPLVWAAPSERCIATLLPRLVPSHGVRWLWREPAISEPWVGFLGCPQASSVLDEIVVGPPSTGERR